MSFQPPWDLVLDLAWESFAEGTIGVGAVITDAAGSVVATGRNAISSDGGDATVVTGSTLAHAEVNAIARLGPTRPEAHLVLWSSLQPCLLCVSASILGGVDEIHFLAPDPLWEGIERLPEINAFVASRWAEHHFDEGEPLTSFAWTLAVHDLIVQRRAASVAVAAAEGLRPDLMERADSAAAAGGLGRAREAGLGWRRALEESPPWALG